MKNNNLTRFAGWLLLTVAGAAAASEVPGPLAQANRALINLSLEELANVQVTSVAGRGQPLAAAPGSIYVISGQDIRRSGARSIPEALQLAPNLQVARTGANGYAITARGFNSTITNRLLVLVDGRTIYTPTFSGVFWDAQDVLLEDVERIEVISGPGGVLWGANAVNGVINILTRNSADTQGTMISADGGGGRATGAARYGGRLTDGSYRIYAKSVRQDDLRSPVGANLRDGAEMVQAGFRADLARGADRFTLQGDLYGAQGHQVPQPTDLEGFNLLGRWQRQLADGGSLRVQAYADHAKRPQQLLDTLDLEFAHALAARGAHRIMWGGGVRQAHDRYQNSAAFAFLPADKKLSSINVYVQDEIALGRSVDATLGAKVDRNAYTGVEFLPSARLAWRPTTERMLWAAWSRAVRAPARIDREFYFPGAAPFLVGGGAGFQSEISHVYELGYRGQPGRRVAFSATAFYHDHHKVRTLTAAAPWPVLANDREGHTAGVEGWATFRASDSWRLEAGYTHLRTKLRVRPGVTDLQAESGIGADPRQWWKLRSVLDLGDSWQLDVMARHYGGLASRSTPAYTAVDLRLGWMPARNVELSVLVQNLFDDRHLEWNPGAAIRRAGVLRARFDF